VPASLALTRADTNGGQNGNIPVTFVEEFRPRAAPKSNDPDQTTFIQINIQQAVSINYATLLLNGTSEAQVRMMFAGQVRSVDAPAPPPVGDAARSYHLQIVNGNNQTGQSVLAFRERQVFVVMVATAPYGRENTQLLNSLAQTLAGRIMTEFSVPPAAPTNARASAQDQTHIRVDWDRQSDNEDGFGVVDTATQQSAGSADAAVTTATISGLKPGTQYCYAIFAFNSFGTSGSTNQACATTSK